jgi:hypothetical protein
MAGAGGQTTMIVPSHDLVVVRLGHYKGEATGTVAFRKALTLLMEAVPRIPRDSYQLKKWLPTERLAVTKTKV